MRILFVAPRFHTNQQGWVEALQANGHVVQYIVFHKLETAEHYQHLTPNLAPTTPLPKFVCASIDVLLKLFGRNPRIHFYRLPQYRNLKKQIKEFKPDLIIVRDLMFPLSLASFLIAKKLNIPALLYNQLPIEATESVSTRLFRKIGLVPNIRITPSRTSEMAHNGKTNAFYVPLITNFSYDYQSKNIAENTLRILTIGKLYQERKKINFLIESLSKEANPVSFKLTLIGLLNNENDPVYKKLLTTITVKKLWDRVTIYPNVPYEKMSEYYQNHDIFILPSVDEPYSISPIEAMNFGVPVILTDSNGARGIIKNGENGYIVKSEDDQALLEAIQHFSNKEQLAYMSRKAFESWQGHFSPQTFLAHFDTICKELNLFTKQ